MLGNECMIAPVYVQNTSGRVVYLPEDMLLVRLRAYNDMDLVPMKKGHPWVDARLHDALLHSLCFREDRVHGGHSGSSAVSHRLGSG